MRFDLVIAAPSSPSRPWHPWSGSMLSDGIGALRKPDPPPDTLAPLPDALTPLRPHPSAAAGCGEHSKTGAPSCGLDKSELEGKWDCYYAALPMGCGEMSGGCGGFPPQELLARIRPPGMHPVTDCRLGTAQRVNKCTKECPAPSVAPPPRCRRVHPRLRRGGLRDCQGD
jgi:hypothetical protein